MAGRQVLGIDNIGSLTKLNPTVVRLASSVITLGGLQYTTGILNCDVTTTGYGGLDSGSVQAFKTYNVFAVLNGSNAALVASLAATPIGYTTYKKVGSFNTATAGAINGASANNIGSVGDIIHSMLSEEAFIALNGGGWILADGRDVTGSTYATVTGNSTTPDMRGQFLRGKNNSRSDGDEDPDGERVAGSIQTDLVGPHNHDFLASANETSVGRITDGSHNNGTNTSAILNTGAGIGSETRPKNIAVNIFIKVN